MDASAIVEFLVTFAVAVVCAAAGWIAAGRAARHWKILAAIGFALAVWPVLTHIYPDRFYVIYPAVPFGRTLFGAGFLLCGVLARTYADTSFRRILQGVLAVAMLYFVLGESLWLAANAGDIKRLEGRIEDGVTIQSIHYTCVPSSAATVLRRWGVEVAEGEMAYRVRTSFQGTNPAQVIAVIEHAGRNQRITARLASTNLNELMRYDRPAILLGEIGPLRHAVALIGLDEQYVTLGDPLRGRISVERARLASVFQWNGLAILVDSYQGDPRSPTLRSGRSAK